MAFLRSILPENVCFPTLGAVPGDWNFGSIYTLYFFVSDNDASPICKRNYAKTYSTFSVSSNNVVQPPIIFTINSSYLSVYSGSPCPKQDKFGVVLNSLMETVEKVQHQAALSVTGAWKGSIRSKL